MTAPTIAFDAAQVQAVFAQLARAGVRATITRLHCGGAVVVPRPAWRTALGSVARQAMGDPTPNVTVSVKVADFYPSQNPCCGVRCAPAP